ncbi:MAG TPA: 1-phosphofructokinase family hexose kinase [Candidatus Methylomirabilis sp.]|nr:1-phosphofructokinase family hexose kinase [Candidatus Methylomirabilis sp.]
MPVATLTMNPAIDVSSGVDYVTPDHKLRCAPPRYEPGGGGINVARAIRRLGGDALALFPGGGPAGALLRELLTAEGVRHRCFAVRGWTRENLNITERVTGRQFRFVMPGPTLAEPEWQAILLSLGALDPRPRFLVASGSLPPGVPADFYAQLARVLHERGVALVLDASGESLWQTAAEGVYLLKPSMREFEELTGEHGCDESRLPALGARLIAEGRCQVLVLSLGARGVLWMSATERGRLAAPAVPVKSSVGAGDSLVAGIVWSLSCGRALADAVRFGVAAGAASVMNPGTELCRAEDVERLYAEVVAAPTGR